MPPALRGAQVREQPTLARPRGLADPAQIQGAARSHDGQRSHDGYMMARAGGFRRGALG